MISDDELDESDAQETVKAVLKKKYNFTGDTDKGEVTDLNKAKSSSTKLFFSHIIYGFQENAIVFIDFWLILIKEQIFPLLYHADSLIAIPERIRYYGKDK